MEVQSPLKAPLIHRLFALSGDGPSDSAQHHPALGHVGDGALVGAEQRRSADPVLQGAAPRDGPLVDGRGAQARWRRQALDDQQRRHTATRAQLRGRRARHGAHLQVGLRFCAHGCGLVVSFKMAKPFTRIELGLNYFLNCMAELCLDMGQAVMSHVARNPKYGPCNWMDQTAHLPDENCLL